MAIELITTPTLLVIVQPSDGLDESEENHCVGERLRQASIVCAVVVAVNPQHSQTSLTHLDKCDQVVLLTRAGTTAFVGSPPQIESAMGTTDWSEVFAQVSADPEGAHRAFRARHQAAMAQPEVAAPWPPPAGLAIMRQIRLVTRRQRS